MSQQNTEIEEQYIISTKKYIVLSLLSFGFYDLWWVYKAWQFFQQKDNLRIRPALRAIFSVVFLIPLLHRIKQFARSKGYHTRYSSVLLYVCIVIVNVSIYLPEPYPLISLLTIVFLIPPFRALNFAKRNSTELKVREQTFFSVGQIAIIVIFIIFLLFVISE